MAIDFTIPTRHPKHNVSQVAAYTWLAGWKDGWMDQQRTANEASLDRLMPEMLALLQSGEHHGSRQKADS